MWSTYVNMYNLEIFEIYDEFLSDTYMAEIMKMHTSEHILSILSVQLINASLWLPLEEQIRNSTADGQYKSWESS